MLYLLDSSAVLNDFSFQFSSKDEYITTPLAIDEFKDMRSKYLMENALQNSLLKIKEPSNESMQSIKEKIIEEGFSSLSKTDVSLLALALDLKKEEKKFLLITDDYSIQNFCSLLKIPFESVIRGKIKGTISFSLKCPVCGKAFFPPGKKPWENSASRKPSENAFKSKKCPICGSALKRVKTQ